MEMAMSSLRKTGLAILMMLLCGVSALAQSTATINGTVTDSTGAVIPNATITATNTQAKTSRSTKTDESGNYLLPQLVPGNYDIQVSMTGFSTVKRTGQQLLVGTTITMDFPLAISSTDQVVQVSAVSAEIERTQSEVVGMLEPEQLDNLPIQSRNFSELASLTPGVQSTSQTSAGFAVGGAVTGVTVGNSTQYATGYMVDNIPIFKPSDGGLYVAIAQDWVQEFSVTTNQPPAEYVGAVSGYVNAVTRSGGNSTHGRAYGFFQNSALNASNTNPVTPITTKAPTSSQRFGGMVGGKFIQDKLFYFAGYEYFRSLAGVIYSGLPSQFAGTRGVLPTDMTPQNISNLNRQDLAQLKLTYQPRTSDSFEVIGNYQKINEPNIAAGGVTTPENGNTTHVGDYQEAVNWTHMFSQSAVNSFRVANARNWDTEQCLYASIVGPYSGANTSSPAYASYGTTPYGSPTGYYAQLTYPGAKAGTTAVGTVNTGCNGRWGGKHFIGLFGGFYDTFSKTKGKHEVKLGGSLAKPYYGSDKVHSNSDGLYTFPTSQTGAFNPSDATTYPQQLTMNWGPLSHSYVQSTGWYFGVFAQDTWRTTPNLTINTGIRWDGDTSYSYFSAHYLAFDGQPVNNDMRTISPRVGVSWTPFKDKGTVIRGGYGVFYSPTPITEVTAYISQRTNPIAIIGFNSSNVSGNPYCLGQASCSTANQNALRELMAWSLQNNTIPDLSLTSVNVGGTNYTLPGFTGTIPKSGLYNIDPDIRKAATQQVTGGISRDFHHGVTATADVVYVYGFDLDIERNENINPIAQSTGTVSYINPNYTSIFGSGSLGFYKNFQILTKVRYHDHRGDQLQASYTFSKATGNSSSSQDFNLHQLGVLATNPFNINYDFGPGNTDQRHYLAVNANARLPFGIEFAPILTISSGLPMTATTTQSSSSNAPITVNLSNGRGTQVVTVPDCPAYYAQCYPAINGTLEKKGVYRGANTFSFNGRLQKTIHLGGSRTLLPMFEAYNIPNHVNYGTNYQMQATSSAFLTPSNTSITMRQIQLGIRFDF